MMYGDLKSGVHQGDASGKLLPTGEAAEDVEGDATQVFVPAFDEEESSTYNTNVPKKFQCDACTGIAFTLTNAFVTQERLLAKALPESEYYDLIEKVCNEEIVGQYGIKSRHGNAYDKVFSGPGLKAHDLPDGQFGGEHWDKRMTKLCEELVDEFGEEEIYEMHRSTSKDIRKDLCKKQCAKPKGSAKKQPSSPPPLQQKKQKVAPMPAAGAAAEAAAAAITAAAPSSTAGQDSKAALEVAQLRRENAELRSQLRPAPLLAKKQRLPWQK